MEEVFYIGIDPGGSGGIAIISDDGKLFASYKMPETPLDIYDLFAGYNPLNSKEIKIYVSACLERVHGMPGMSGAAMFSFGNNYGHLQMALLANRIPFEDHTPQKWMKYYQLKRAKTESKTEWKNRLKEKAQQLYPDHKVTLAISDAILIAHYWYKINNQ